MTRRKRFVCFCALSLTAAGLIVAVATPSTAQVRQEAGEISVTAITQPSKRVERSFYGLGVIESVAVKEGDTVKTGQLLMAQDQEIERLELERMQAEANSAARVEFAEADLGVKRAVYKRKTTAGEGVYPVAEIEEAELDVVSREKSLEIAELDNAQNKIKARQQEAKVVRMNLTSTIDGVVEKIENWEGEMADPSKPSIIIVKNDPMYIEIRDLNTRQVARLQVGEAMEVKYAEEGNWQPAKIVFIAPVADAASDTQLVRLEMPNPDQRATGLPIQVKLPAKLIEQLPAADRAAFSR